MLGNDYDILIMLLREPRVGTDEKMYFPNLARIVIGKK